MTLHPTPVLAALLLSLGLAAPMVADAQDRSRLREPAAERDDQDARRGEARQQRERQAGQRQGARGNEGPQRNREQQRRETPAAPRQRPGQQRGADPRVSEQREAAQRRATQLREQQRRGQEQQQAERRRADSQRRIADQRRQAQERERQLRDRRDVDRREHERRMAEQRRREAEHQRHQRELREAQRRYEQRLAQQRRIHQQRYLRDYYARLHARDMRWGSYNASWYSAPVIYRYQRDGRYHDVNRYAADLLQQAVDLGYREGRNAGRADREDGWQADYRNSYAWQDASYGYNGWYVDRDEYAHYFREGFRRGYDDGYYGRSEYGRRSDSGDYLILAAVLGAILGFQQI